jgi:hypothetical protein
MDTSILLTLNEMLLFNTKQLEQSAANWMTLGVTGRGLQDLADATDPNSFLTLVFERLRKSGSAIESDTNTLKPLTWRAKSFPGRRTLSRHPLERFSALSYLCYLKLRSLAFRYPKVDA